MKKLTKIGASALAGSLVAVSASAGELSVSGTWELTYKSDDNTVSGNPFGSKSSIAFNGSGDVDGLGTATWFAATQDDNGSTFASHLITLDMGDMGSFGFDQGVGQYGVSTIDDKSPTAWEESWHNTANSSGGLSHSGGSSGVLGYANSVAGFDLTVEYAPETNSGDNGDGGAGVGNTSLVSGSNVNFAITSSSLVDGLTIGAGAGDQEYSDSSTAANQDGSSSVAFANYSMGPVTVGYTGSSSSNVRSTNANDGGREVEAYGIAFNVNEALSVSWNQHTLTYKKKGAGPDVDQESTGVAVAYTMGGAKLAIQNNQQDNSSGTAGSNDEITEVSLSLAF
ncbi:porin [Candidatus Pelagibacter sp.]|uniref:porin n=1 Tax=Candidatus Pelagibacter sp. TaxID=2024849 RepID=UPI003F835B3B